jgi:hypothetical protein
MKRIKGQEDFFLGGRSFGKFIQPFSMFGQATSAESAVIMSSTVAQKGLAGVFYSGFPFTMLILFGLFGKQNDNDVRDRFYARLLTPVNPDHEADKIAVAKTVANPHIMDGKKLRPDSDWNFRKWDWQDWKGIVISVVSIICIGGLMLFMANLGK